MAVAWVQSGTASIDAASSECIVKLPSNSTAGNFLALAFSYGTGASNYFAWNVSGDGNTWVTLTSTTEFWDTTNHQGVAMFYAKNIAGGAVNLHVGAVVAGDIAFWRVSVAEYSGVDTTNPIDGSTGVFNSAANTTANGVTSGLFSTSSNNSMLYSMVVDTAGVATMSYGTGFTRRDGLDWAKNEEKLQAVAGTTSATWTFVGTDPYCCAVMAMKASGAVPQTFGLAFYPMFIAGD